ncbi:MAG TPA: 3'-5' exonuclease, partial [Myxococcota bacterium]|nr:3'-5' exonuclease [Myxococcota bacterium]
FLVGMEEGIFPHSASTRDVAGLEEERRLCYVGMTRARERLLLSCARERRRYGAHSFATPSRFLSEIPPSLTIGADFELSQARLERGRALDYSVGQEQEEGIQSERGARVRHPIFGEGTVLEATGSGAGRKLRVRFDRVGVKTVVVRFAQLEPADA